MRSVTTVSTFRNDLKTGLFSLACDTVCLSIYVFLCGGVDAVNCVWSVGVFFSSPFFDCFNLLLYAF